MLEWLNAPAGITNLQMVVLLPSFVGALACFHRMRYEAGLRAAIYKQIREQTEVLEGKGDALTG